VIPLDPVGVFFGQSHGLSSLNQSKGAEGMAGHPKGRKAEIKQDHLLTPHWFQIFVKAVGPAFICGIKLEYQVPVSQFQGISQL
jgi:hypothetical protein